MYLGAQLEQGQAWAVLTLVLKVRFATNKSHTLTGNSLAGHLIWLDALIYYTPSLYHTSCRLSIASSLHISCSSTENGLDTILLGNYRHLQHPQAIRRWLLKHLQSLAKPVSASCRLQDFIWAWTMQHPCIRYASIVLEPSWQILKAPFLTPVAGTYGC